MTQPTLTRNIQALEDRVGEAVLERSRYGVKPTAIGTRLGEVGKRILEEESQAEEVLQQWKHGYVYEVRIGVGPIMQSAIMNDFIDSYPRNRNHVLHFKTGSANHLIPELERGSLDILLAPSALDLDQSSLIRETVFRDEVRVFAGKKSRLYGSSEQIDPKELQNENWMLSGAAAGFIDPRSSANALTQPDIILTGAIQMVAHLLEKRDVLVRMPVRMMIAAGFAQPEGILNVSGEIAKRDIAIWTSPRAMDQRAVQQVHNHLKDHFIKLNDECPMFGVEADRLG